MNEYVEKIQSFHFLQFEYTQKDVKNVESCSQLVN